MITPSALVQAAYTRRNDGHSGSHAGLMAQHPQLQMDWAIYQYQTQTFRCESGSFSQRLF